MPATPPRPEQLAEQFILAMRNCLAHSAERIRHCLNQLDTEQIWWRPREDQNSIGNLMLHLGGNLRQWIISGVGGAPDVRRRPEEFSERGPMPKGELEGRLDQVLDEADAVLARTGPTQLVESRRIQGSETTVLAAIVDSVSHFCGHSQEIVSLTRQQLGDAYQFHWAPKTREQGAPE
jgi:hypothetical protein